MKSTMKTVEETRDENTTNINKKPETIKVRHQNKNNRNEQKLKENNEQENTEGENADSKHIKNKNDATEIQILTESNMRCKNPVRGLR